MKINKFIYTTLLLVFIILIGAFYWYELRPAKIKHDCSWAKMVNPAKPAEPAITEEDVKNSRLKYDKCIADEAKSNSDRVGRKSLFSGLFCDNMLKQERPAIPAKAEQVWYREADKDEYNFCIHEKGL